RDSGAEVLLVDDELEAPQQRRLEDALQARVVDRTQLILDIFAQHAVSAEGKLQVELAQLEYNLPRMRGMWQHLERLGGGVGTRGPGESQLETDRRLARRRVTLLRARLRELSKQRQIRRKARSRSGSPTSSSTSSTRPRRRTGSRRWSPPSTPSSTRSAPTSSRSRSSSTRSTPPRRSSAAGLRTAFRARCRSRRSRARASTSSGRGS